MSSSNGENLTSDKNTVELTQLVDTKVKFNLRANVVKTRRVIWKFTKGNPAGSFGGAILLVIIILVLSASLLSPFRFDRSVGSRLAPVGSEARDGNSMVLGADEIGRDVFTRTLHGGRTSLYVGLAAPLIGVGLGLLLGISSAYFGGVIDMTTQRIVDSLLIIPGLVLSMVITLSFGFSLEIVVLAIAINLIGGVSRVIRSHALALRESQYVEALEAMGASNTRIIFKHLIPNSFAPAMVLFAVSVGGAITTEASLSFLGLGIAPPRPSWGSMLSNAQEFFRSGVHIVLVPGVAIGVTVLAVNLFGDALRDALDPRLRGRD
jgi:peptide/nickel transport system permease protein